MKKVLFTLSMFISVAVFAQQSVLAENFDALTIGNMGTATDGTTVAQNGWYIQGGAVSDFQVTNVDLAHGKSLQITSGNGAPPATGANTNNRFAWKAFSAAANTSNDIIRVAAQFYTGAATGAGRIQLVAYDTTVGTIGGISYDYATKTITGLARVSVVANPTQAGTLNLTLGTQTYPANSWVSVLYSYNKTTGQHTYTYSDGTTNGGSYSFSGSSTYAVVPNLVAAEADIFSITMTGNTVANTASVDNIAAEFTNNAILPTDEIIKVAAPNNKLFVYPNPVSETLNIKTDEKVKSVTIYDASGKRIETRLENNQVDVRGLESGNYIITIETENGISSEKFIKE